MNKFKQSSLVLALGLVSTALSLQAEPVDVSKLPPASTQQGVTFDKDIHPLFKASCVRCHSGQRPKARLRLDTLEDVLKGGKEGKVVMVGESAKSQLVISAARIDPDTAMPPKPHAPRKAPAGASQPAHKTLPPPKPLTAQQVSLVRAWIDQGAK